ncbi:MAG: hypothetical protein ACRD3V_04910, partial [Vicinamibacteria bacterium]
MRIAHVGPPLMRTGGPSGYLLELSRAAESSTRENRHDVRFPEMAPPRPRKPEPSRLRKGLRRAKRALAGPPRFYRPSKED